MANDDEMKQQKPKRLQYVAIGVQVQYGTQTVCRASSGTWADRIAEALNEKLERIRVQKGQQQPT